jgi:hypothetical protein
MIVSMLRWDEQLGQKREGKAFGPLTRKPKDKPGKVIRLPKVCGVCRSKQLAYDCRNVVTCIDCDSILSVSGIWHASSKAHGADWTDSQGKPLDSRVLMQSLNLLHSPRRKQAH